MYAVIRSGGKQYRVAPGDTVHVERMDGKIGAKVTFGDVLSVRTDDPKTLSGKDASSAKVAGKILKHTRGPKVTVMKYKSCNQYKIMRGHRQNYTAIEIGEIAI